MFVMGTFSSGSPNNRLVGYRSASEKASKSSSIIILLLFCSITVFFTDGNIMLTKKNIKLGKSKIQKYFYLIFLFLILPVSIASKLGTGLSELVLSF